jgi:hypothetical protein
VKLSVAASGLSVGAKPVIVFCPVSLCPEKASHFFLAVLLHHTTTRLPIYRLLDDQEYHKPLDTTHFLYGLHLCN